MKAFIPYQRLRASAAIIGILCVCLGGTPATADDRPWYVTGLASVVFPQNADFNSPQALGTGQRIDLRGDITFNVGGGAGIAAGRVWNDFRIEGEGLWLKAGLDDVEVSRHMGSPVTSEQEARLERVLDVSGNMSVWTGMVNVHYDVPTGKALRPYVGAGAGTAHAFMNKKASIGNTLRDGTTVEFATDDKDEDRWGFCWQARAGVGFSLSESLTVQLGYRFVHLPSLKFHLFEDLVENPTIVTIKPLHAVDLGLRLNF